MTKTISYLYLEIAESIRRLIASGVLQPGEKLSPIREMAQKWNCNPGTVGRAYTILAQEGLVEGHRGSGTRVVSSTLRSQPPGWQWASLVNRAEQFLLGAIGSGYSPTQATAALSLAVSRWRDMQRENIPDVTPEDHTCLRFVGSHDLIIESLADFSADKVDLCIDYAGSLGGLIALVQGKADICGIHLWDAETNCYNIPFVQRLLPGRSVVLLTLVLRSLGIILPAGNPQNISSLGDLSQPELQLRLINRQPGSGTRVWLDSQLKSLDIHPDSIPGYEQEALTHLAVAREIAEGNADLGLGIHSAAAAYGLYYIPLTQEKYDLVIPEDIWKTNAMQALARFIRSDSFMQSVMPLGGYNMSETGQEFWMRSH